MNWKTNLKAAKMAFSKGMAETKKTPREKMIDELTGLNQEQLSIEQILVFQDMLKRLQLIDREVVRIRNNVIFFFWVFVLSILFWVFMFLAGGLAALSAFGA